MTIPLALLKRRRFVVATLAAVFACILLVAAGVFRPPQISRLWRVASRVAWSRLAICVCAADQHVRFRRDDGLTIAASIYRDDQRDERPGLLVVHGNTPLGRRLPVYRVLATKLAGRGYVVLTMDMTGYGESADPFEIGALEAVENESDVRAGISYLRNLPGVDTQRIYVLGHSAGVPPVLAAGIADPVVKKIVAIGPPRRLTERLLDQGDREYFWRRADETHVAVYGAPFPTWFGLDEWLRLKLSRDISGYLPYLSGPTHKPILLIDGDLENEADKRYLRAYYDSMSQPKQHLTIPGSNHYANTPSRQWLLTFYDEAVVNETVDQIDVWLKK